MPGFALITDRSKGRALAVGNAACREAAMAVLQRLGYETVEADDPYAAMAELCQRPLAFRAVVLSLSGLFREELQIIASIKRRFGHVEIWLAQIDGRAAALAEASRLGADGLLSDEGLHRFSQTGEEVIAPIDSSRPRPEIRDEPLPSAEPLSAAPQSSPPMELGGECADDSPGPDPLLTADELRALLEDPPSHPVIGDESSKR